LPDLRTSSIASPTDAIVVWPARDGLHTVVVLCLTEYGDDFAEPVLARGGAGGEGRERIDFAWLLDDYPVQVER